MSYRSPKSKFEMYFIAIGNLLYYGALLGAVVFIIGYGVYKLFGWKWFKDNPTADLWIAWIIGVSIIFCWVKLRKDE